MKTLYCSALLIAFSLLDPAKAASSQMNAAFSEANSGKYGNAVRLFERELNNIDADDYPRLVQANIGMGLTYIGQDKSTDKVKKYIEKGICAGISSDYIDPNLISCEKYGYGRDLTDNKESSEALAAGLAVLASDAATQEEYRRAFQFLGIAHDVLLRSKTGMEAQLEQSADADKQNTCSQMIGSVLESLPPQMRALAMKSVKQEADCGKEVESDSLFQMLGNANKKKVHNNESLLSILAAKYMCISNSHGVKPDIDEVMQEYTKQLAFVMEVKRGNALSRYQLVKDMAALMEIEAFYKKNSQLAEVSDLDSNSLSRQLLQCDSFLQLNHNLEIGITTSFLRGSHTLAYYEKAYELSTRSRGLEDGVDFMAITNNVRSAQLMVQQYLMLNLTDKADAMYRKVMALISQQKNYYNRKILLADTNALVSYGGFLKQVRKKDPNLLLLADKLSKEDSQMTLQEFNMYFLEGDERVRNKMLNHINNSGVRSQVNQMSMEDMLADMGLNLPEGMLQDGSSQFAEIQKKLQNVLDRETLDEMLKEKMPTSPEAQKFLVGEGSESFSDTLNSDFMGTRVEESWQAQNQQRMFQLYMAQLQLSLDNTTNALKWLEKKPYNGKLPYSSYSNVVLAYQHYVYARYHQARNKHKLASHNFKQAIEQWYFAPLPVETTVFYIFPSNTYLLEQAAIHEVENGDQMLAFTYIEVARQASLGNPRLYGYLDDHKLELFKRNTQQMFNKLVDLAGSRAVEQGQHDAYSIAKQQSQKRRASSMRSKSGPLLPLYAGLAPFLQWLDLKDYGDFTQRMTLFQTLYDNRKMLEERSAFLVGEKQKRDKEKKIQNMAEMEQNNEELEDMFRSNGGKLGEVVAISSLIPKSSSNDWLNLENLSQKYKLIEPDTTVLSYWMTKHNVYVFAINKGEIKTEVIANQQIVPYIDNVNIKTFSKSGAGLYKHLIAPYKEMLNRHLVILTNGPLQNIPFAAIPDADGYLGDKHLIRYAPGIEYAFKVPSKKSSSPKEMLVLAPTDVNVEGQAKLDAAKKEANFVAALFSADSYLDSDVTRQLVANKLPEYSLLHYAGHASLDQNLPDFSHLALAKDKHGKSNFYVNDIKKLPLQNMSLAVLSACESAMSNSFNLNNDFSTLSGAFLEAGARSVVASLWKVDDAVAATFMTQFYQHLKDGKSKSEAVQIAQQYVRGLHPGDPSLWAAFVLTGADGYL